MQLKIGSEWRRNEPYTKLTLKVMEVSGGQIDTPEGKQYVLFVTYNDGKLGALFSNDLLRLYKPL